MKKILIFIYCLLFLTYAFAKETLIIEPDEGRAPLLSTIQNAKTSIDLVIYGITDKALINALIRSKEEGKKVKILLEPTPYKSEDENKKAIEAFQSANITIALPNSHFDLTHQKTFIIDNHEAIIMTFNLTRSAFTNERNFALITDNSEAIAEINRVFTSDVEHTKPCLQNPNLIWSPENSREKIINLIKDAHAEIKIYAQDLTDYQTIGTLAKAARSGKKVQIITSNKNKINRKFNYLKRAGVIIHYNKNYIIHAKIIIIDQSKAVIGSINLTHPSLNLNRELSIITQDEEVIKKLLKIFDLDWSRV